MLSLLFLALALLLALFAARFEVMLFPDLLHVVIELLLGDLQGLSQVFEEVVVVVLLGPVRGIEAIVVADGRFDARIDEQLADLGLAVLRRDVQRRETRFVLQGGVPAVGDEEFAGVVQVLLHGLVEGRILTYFVVFLEIRVCTVLKQHLDKRHVLHLHRIVEGRLAVDILEIHICFLFFD